ncbi:MAG: hypothetical protein BroJett021_15610 [Chloroflexota bacterium]|nr:hypothetical protein [Caldilinea sp.]GIK72573.1 MAG: hypothetical protein BroJett021_15610 [Chloroflexota bacterium]
MSAAKLEQRQVPADLIEATPGAMGMWLLASPLLLFILWAWVDLFAHFSPIPWYWLDVLLGAGLFLVAAVLPLGWLAHRLVTSLPRLFQHAGWDVQPLEPVREQEMYLVRYVYQAKHRAPNSWQRQWLRAAQGWVYIEIAAILLGGVLMIPLFFSALDFGFGR